MGLSKIICLLTILIIIFASSAFASNTPLDDTNCNAKIKILTEKSVDRNIGANIFVEKGDLVEKICRYVTMIFSNGTSKISELDEKDVSSALLRLSKSSLAFLYCDLDDWECIETTNIASPKSDFRSSGKGKEDIYGKGTKAGKSFNVEYFFADHMRKDRNAKPEDPMAKKLIKFIENTKEELLMALYGVDDGVMEIIDKILEKDKELTTKYREARVFGVFDSEPDLFKYNFTYENSIPKIIEIKKPLLFSYVTPDNEKDWVFGRPNNIDKLSQINTTVWNKLKKEADGNKTAIQILQQMATNSERLRVAFKYNKTGELIKALNNGIESEETAVARIEMPMDGAIQHNKFLVSDELSVWTGTTNVAGDCIGDELNSNIGIKINNSTIAKEFKSEFLEMFTFDPSLKLKVSFLANSEGGEFLPAGRFHLNKRPNTKRYFTFDDGTEVRVHFAPTDDAEHRVILPLLYSAKPGDRIRISMFGNSGNELTTAIRYAANNGARVEVLLDHISAAQKSSWTHPLNPSNICEAKAFNPQKPKEGGISVITSGATGSFNHMKVGIKNNEILIIGSQNWSLPGNDSNDENMVTIRKSGGLPIIKDANSFFEKMWKGLIDKRAKEGAEETKKHGPWICGEFPEKSKRDEEKE